ncbi:hypothetical protein WN943_011223 [Citrus x changshan-huyou]
MKLLPKSLLTTVCSTKVGAFNSLSTINVFPFRRLSTMVTTLDKNPTFINPSVSENSMKMNRNPIPIPHRTLPEPKGQDLDFVNIAYSHLIHSDWKKLTALSTHLTPFRVKHVLLKVQKDYVLSLEFFTWVQTHKPSSLTLETHSIVLHILTKNRKFKSSESILRGILDSDSFDLPSKFFDSILYSYRMCDSSPLVFDLLFKTYAHRKKFRNATDTFCQMRDYGFLPIIESCNKFLSSLLDSERVDIALGFYKEMRRNRISPNVYTLNMVMHAFCKLGNIESTVEVFKNMESMGFIPSVTTYNTLISGHCNKGLLSLAMKFKNLMEKNGIQPNVITFNTLIFGFCKKGKLHEANRIFSEMKATNVSPNVVTYNTLINGYGQVGNSEMGASLYEEMLRNGIKVDILTYNALILGLCKKGKTKKAAYLVKDLDKNSLVPNASTYSALITGQCVRKNSERAFQLCKSMIRSGCRPNKHIFEMLMSTFCQNEDFDRAAEVLLEMLEKCMAPDSIILSELYCGLHHCGKDELAMKLFRKMEIRGLLPKGFDKLRTINCAPENGEKESGGLS